jgi:hypothetical protein
MCLKPLRALLFVLFIFIYSHSLHAQISGVVFRDYNANGVKDNISSFNETFVAGITVRVTLPNNTFFTTTTNTAGTFNFTVAQVPVGTKVRVEFSGLGSEEYTSASGAGNASNVQFVTAPAATISYAINATEDFWDNAISPNPTLLAVANRRGSINGHYKNHFSIVQTNNNASGPDNPVDQYEITTDTTKRVAIHEQTGSIMGLAYQRKTDRFFNTAFLKRSVGLGPQGAGGVYIIAKSGSDYKLAGGFTLQGVTPANGGAPLDFGSVTRVSSPASNDNYLSDTWTWVLPDGSDGRDNDAFTKVGTMSYGDIEADPNSDKLYTVNLFQRKLIVINTDAATATLNNAAPAVLTPYVEAYNITALPGCPAPTGAGNNIRPFAVKIYKGKGYLTIVSDAISTQAVADLKGYVLQFDPANINAGFTTVLTIDFDKYSYSNISATMHRFNPWTNSWPSSAGWPAPQCYMQPMISSLEFNEDGSMDIGMRDRWGDQGGSFEFIAMPGATTHTQTVSMGELLHACWNGTNWILEGTSGSCVQPNVNGNPGAPTLNRAGWESSYGKNASEYYADVSGDHREESLQGSLTKLMGSGRIISTVYDPIADGMAPGSNYWSTQGLQWNNVTTGVKSKILRLIPGNGSLDKGNALGDIEFVMPPQAPEIGNRIWHDANGNGIQDANENTPGVVAGTIVTLRSPGLDGVFGNADDQTWTTTTDANGNYYFKTLATPDNRKPAHWTGIGNMLLNGFLYRIEVPLPSGKSVSIADAGANDAIDNDASLILLNAVVEFKPSNTSHNFDIGLRPLIVLPLQFISFAATKTDQTTAKLNWQTATLEIPVSFEIERSVNSIDFVKIGTVKSTSFTRYEFFDNGMQSGKSYYRIKMIGTDGTIVYTDIKTLNNDGSGQLMVFPNPAKDVIHLMSPDDFVNNKVTIQVYSIDGRLYIEKNITRAAAIEQINISTLAAGRYVIKTFAGDVKFVQQITVTH